MKVKATTEIAAIARERRRRLGLSQAQLAKAAGVGRDWVVQFEKGKATIEWGLVMRVLRELQLAINLEVVVQNPVPTGEDLDQILKSTLTDRRP